jgi:hypothetical protein
MAEPLVLVGEIGRPHGVRGLVHLRSFCAAPGDIALYGPLSDGAGRRFAIEWLGNGLVRIEGVADRDAAARQGLVGAWSASSLASAAKARRGLRHAARDGGSLRRGGSLRGGRTADRRLDRGKHGEQGQAADGRGEGHDRTVHAPPRRPPLV